MIKTLKKIRHKMIELGERSMQKGQDIKNMGRKKADGFIEQYLTSEGKEQLTAKKCLMQLSIAYNIYTADYLGGSPKVPKAEEGLKMMIIPQGIMFSNQLDLLTFDEIKKISFQTRQQIEKDVTLTRMLAFGVYSLAMKKKRKVIHNYLVLDCEKGGMPYKMVFAGGDIQSIYQEVFYIKAV